MQITLDNDRAAKAWTIVFEGSRDMPNGVAIPLPLGNDATLFQVTEHVRKLFPTARIATRAFWSL